DLVVAGTCGAGTWTSGAPTGTSPATASYTAVQADVGTQNYFAFVCDSKGACSPSRSGTFTVTNNTPTITGVTASPNPAPAGSTIDFDVSWLDPGDTVRALICKTNDASGG